MPSLLAIMLGRLKMSIDECIDVYLDISAAIFQKQRSRLNWRGRVQGRFDTVTLTEKIQQCVQISCLTAGNDELLYNHDQNVSKVFVCAGSKDAVYASLFTSYVSSMGLSDRLQTTKIWQAARATCAATSFFDPIQIGRSGETFMDAAVLHVNNPINMLWNEANRIWPGPEPLSDRIECLISIGTGERPVSGFGDSFLDIARSLQRIATETELTASNFEIQHMTDLVNARKYFRFNVTQGLQNVGLEEHKKRAQIVACTNRYLEFSAQRLLEDFKVRISPPGKSRPDLPVNDCGLQYHGRATPSASSALNTLPGLWSRADWLKQDSCRQAAFLLSVPVVEQ